MIHVSKDLRGLFGVARDQGKRSTCLAFALSDAHAAVMKPWSPLSAEYLFYHAKQRDKTSPKVGTTIPAARAALEHDGQPLETGWPYIGKLPADLSSWKPPSKLGVLFRRVSKESNHGFDEIWSAIESEQPTLLGMTVSRAFFFPDANGVVDSTEPAEPHRRHAIVAVATGRVARKRLILVRNSWGENWGIQGHAWLSERYAAPRILVAVSVS